MRVQGTVDSETDTLILTVDAEGLIELLELLEDPRPAWVSLMPGAECQATRSVRGLRLEATAEDAVAIVIDGEVATITAGPTGFARLARKIRQFGDNNDLLEPGMHAHFDPGPAASSVLAQDSASLIVAGPVPDDVAPTPTSAPRASA
jgi:hypothetical protein